LKGVIIYERSRFMKSFLLYILLPGVVLGVVYQSGRNSGIRSAVESPPQGEVLQVADEVRPAPVRGTVSSNTSLPLRERYSRIPLEGETVSKSQTVKSKAAPAPIRRVSGNIYDSSGGSSGAASDGLPVGRPLQIPRVIEPVDDWNLPAGTRVSKPASVSTYAPATLEPSSTPARSVYDRRPAGSPISPDLPMSVPPVAVPAMAVPARAVPTKPADLGVMPLAPLQPLESAAVYPGVQPVRTTFQAQPVLAPAFPKMQTQSASPVRITSSSGCDCGKQH
jgi:hypothetical protein